MADVTPMMKQYLEIKEQNKDCLLFFRLGDFYEMFSDDAKIASHELDLTLTTRDRSKEKSAEDRVPMCGVPYHSAESYIGRLVARGYKVAICEQLEDPSKAKGLVKRDIVRIVTPGTVTESSMLEETKNNYFACIYGEDGAYGISFCDISTGEFYATACADMDHLRNELGRFAPSEALLGGAAAEDMELRSLLTERLGCCLDQEQSALFDEKNCEQVLLRQFGSPAEELGVGGQRRVIIACGALLEELRAMQKSDISHVRTLEYYMASKYMELDLAARRNLELTQTLRSKEKRGSLLWVIDKTHTAMGSRMLRSWMEKPLLSPADINRRSGAVEELVQKTIPREELICLLKTVTDMERVTARIVTGTANGRDLLSLSSGAARLPDIRRTLEQFSAPLLQTIFREWDALEDLKQLIDVALVDDPPFTVREGGMIRAGYNAEVDRLREVMSGGRGMLTEIETREKERTGIKNLRVGYNRVFGYYIEVAKGQIDLVPKDYIRKQTLANGERYITEELKELENTILTSKDRVTLLEYELFNALREHLAQDAPRVQDTSRQIAILDCLCSFATIAVDNGYCRPEVDLSGEIEISGGRHPVVEKMLKHNMFVPNDTHLSTDGERVAIITGPNMAGKSTYMRQVALIVLLAQMGSFVPARAARIGIVDQIFTRIGASDDLSSGQSTFMVEMTEMAEIIKHATPRSLLILDEIGRGTSTFDGMAIARAVLEYVANRKKLGAKTLFATHYHELTDIEGSLDGVRNYNIAVKKRAGDIVFLRRIVPGATDDSFGVDVAKLAGLPEIIVQRGREILRELEAGAPVRQSAAKPRAEEQLSMEDLHDGEIRRRLAAVAVETLTPIEAMNLLYELKQLL